MGNLIGARCYGKLDLLHGYRQIPLAPEAQKVLTIGTPEGLFSLTRVPQGGSTAITYFQVLCLKSRVDYDKKFVLTMCSAIGTVLRSFRLRWMKFSPASKESASLRQVIDAIQMTLNCRGMENVPGDRSRIIQIWCKA